MKRTLDMLDKTKIILFNILMFVVWIISIIYSAGKPL